MHKGRATRYRDTSGRRNATPRLAGAGWREPRVTVQPCPFSEPASVPCARLASPQRHAARLMSGTLLRPTTARCCFPVCVASAPNRAGSCTCATCKSRLTFLTVAAATRCAQRARRPPRGSQWCSAKACCRGTGRHPAAQSRRCCAPQSQTPPQTRRRSRPCAPRPSPTRPAGRRGARFAVLTDHGSACCPCGISCG